jgi:ABC-2 type transport system permease protein
MEIIISNVSPKTHFFSKVLAGNIFVILQGALLIIYFALGVLIRYIIGGMTLGGGLTTKITSMLTSASSDFISKLVIYIPFILILMLITFLAYSLLAGILASMTTNAEDFNQLQTPIMVISLIGYYLAMMAGVFKGALFIRILSYVPFISAILAPSLLVLGQIGITDIIISTILTILTNYLLIKYGLKIYKVGILNYSSKDLWKKMFKAMKD